MDLFYCIPRQCDDGALSLKMYLTKDGLIEPVIEKLDSGFLIRSSADDKGWLCNHAGLMLLVSASKCQQCLMGTIIWMVN